MTTTIRYATATTLIPSITHTGSGTSEGDATYAGYKSCIISQIGPDATAISLTDFIKSTTATMGSYLLKTQGALSPIMK